MCEDLNQKNKKSRSAINVLTHVIVVNHTTLMTLIDLADVCFNNDVTRAQENA